MPSLCCGNFILAYITGSSVTASPTSPLSLPPPHACQPPSGIWPDLQDTQVASFSLGMAEAFRQQGISLSVFSTYSLGSSSTTTWPSLLFKLFAYADQVKLPTHQLLLLSGAACTTPLSQHTALFPGNGNGFACAVSHIGINTGKSLLLDWLMFRERGWQ